MIKDDEKNVDQQLIEEQIHSDVKKLIDFLPEEQQSVLRMRLYSGMSFKEIAALTQVSINTALGRMRYALINMRKMVEERNVVLQ